MAADGDVVGLTAVQIEPRKALNLAAACWNRGASANVDGATGIEAERKMWECGAVRVVKDTLTDNSDEPPPSVDQMRERIAAAMGRAHELGIHAFSDFTPDAALERADAIIGHAVRLLERQPDPNEHASDNGARQRYAGNGDLSARFRLLTDEEIEQPPPRDDAVAGILPAGGLAALVGPPDTGKSTLALDIGLCIADNRPWDGCAVQPGFVVMIAGEGVGGLGQRLRAWKVEHGVTGTRPVRFLPHAVGLMNANEVDRLLKLLEELHHPVALVIVDTMARCLLGGEENSARDVGLLIAGADRIRAATGASVLLIHHTAKSSNTERGSGALRGAVDTLMFVEREDDLITLTCDKQKDGARFAPRRYRLALVPLDGASACVLKPEEVTTWAPRRPATLPDTRRRALDALRDIDHGEGATAAEWQRVSGVSERTFHRAAKDLVKWELVRQDGKGRGARYVFLGEHHA